MEQPFLKLYGCYLMAKLVYSSSFETILTQKVDTYFLESVKPDKGKCDLLLNHA